MPTIGELIKNEGIVIDRSKEIVEKEIYSSEYVLRKNCHSKRKNRRNEGLSKANKVDRLRKLCKLGKRISFVVLTPGTESGRKFHCVHLIDAEVKKTSEGNYIITGIDAELSLAENYNELTNLPKNIILTKNFVKNVFRSYRIDRILNGTILFS